MDNKFSRYYLFEDIQKRVYLSIYLSLIKHYLTKNSMTFEKISQFICMVLFRTMIVIVINGVIIIH